MARDIAANSDVAYRAVIVFKKQDGTLFYEYEGIYSSRGTALGRCTFWANWQQARDETGRTAGSNFYDAWVEKADIAWNKVKD